MRNRRFIFLLVVTFSFATLLTFSELRSTRAESGKVTLVRTPFAGIQPQALVDEHGALHLIYFAGDSAGGDVFYVRREAGQTEFSSPLRVNSQPGSAVAAGTVRGAQMALGKNGRVHVAWNGSKKSEPQGPEGSEPMLYARLEDSRKAFEAQRNLMQFSGGLDGGGSVAADRAGNVYVVWHGRGKKEGEAHRRVWVTSSTDDGRTFTREVAAYNEETGACGCCGMRAFVDERGDLYLHTVRRPRWSIAVRSCSFHATTERVFVVLTSINGDSPTCPMSTVAMTLDGRAKNPLAAWENNGQVSYASLDSSLVQKVQPIAARAKAASASTRQLPPTLEVRPCWPGPRALAGSEAVRCPGSSSTIRASRSGKVGQLARNCSLGVLPRSSPKTMAGSRSSTDDGSI